MVSDPLHRWAESLLDVPVDPAHGCVWVTKDEVRAVLDTVLDAERARPDALGEALDGAYRERNAVVASLIRSNGWTSWMVPAPDADGWWIVYAKTPRGQVSWHVGKADLGLFGDTPAEYVEAWDHHTTDEKYARLAALAAPDTAPPALDADRLARAYDKVAEESAFYGLTSREFADAIAAEYEKEPTDG